MTKKKAGTTAPEAPAQQQEQESRPHYVHPEPPDPKRVHGARANKIAIDRMSVGFVAFRLGYRELEDIVGSGDTEVDALIALLKAEDAALSDGVPKNPVIRFAEIYAELKDIGAREDALKSEKDELEQIVLDQFAQMGMDRLTITVSPTGKPVKVTVYQSEETWASAPEGPAAKQAACDALKANGLGSYVSEGFNSQSLSAYVRERIKEARDEKGPGIEFEEIIKVALPQSLLDTLNIRNGFKPKARSGK